MVVKNLHGSTTCSCCPSWLKHWENYSGEKADRCAALGCGDKATLGGHVIKVASADRGRYIIPICDACNKRDEEYELNQGTKLAPASKLVTCKK